MRPPSEEETRSWAVLSPVLRRRAVDRVVLLRRWWGERDGLTAKEAAAIAGVIPNRFYQMASAWKRAPGLAAVGAFAGTPAPRPPRIHPIVNASLQANVVRVVAEGGGKSVEAMRRRLEELVAADLRDRPSTAVDGSVAELAVPSPTILRAVVTRELNRVGEAQLLGESIAMDCCPTTMRSPEGIPWALFAIIDRGTLRILGTSVGSLDESVEGYSLAARRALVLLAPGAPVMGPWARRTRRVDMVVGEDGPACEALITRYAQVGGAIEFKPVTRPRRFGSLLRRYLGDRMGRVDLRPGWAASPPPPMSDGDETFARWDALARADFEMLEWNRTKVIERAAAGEVRPPDDLVALIRLLVGFGGIDTRGSR
ncbi:hypothetical protein [Sphingomonas bacterium]|uniref:hypothetical protein n=1 Tax=Sphingomonas bacterium TaxID=1895847 RepID=UPI0015760614|nr:hypothetical protein [Sphingomonas bacterium]